MLHSPIRNEFSIRTEFQGIESTSPKNHQFLPESQRIQHFSSALSPSSQFKNRYPDILPYNKTRVCLKHQATEGSDYINANFLLKRKYISCQAPLFSTFADFWRMIWEQNCLLIVMLTRLMEGGKTKANTYWPVFHHGCSTLRFGDISVSTIDQIEEEHFTVRRFLLVHGGESREVYQLHYTEWPDFGTPSSTKGIRDLIYYANYLRDLYQNTSPIVVHCSAGVGRSGAFIAIHELIDHYEAENSNDVVPDNKIVEQIVKNMRKDRWGMVQTERQYEFIYRAIQDYLDNRSENIPSTDEEMVDTVSLSSSQDEICLDSPSFSPKPLPSFSVKSNWRNTSANGINTMALGWA